MSSNTQEMQEHANDQGIVRSSSDTREAVLLLLAGGVARRGMLLGPIRPKLCRNGLPVDEGLPVDDASCSGAMGPPARKGVEYLVQ
eukprot:1137269-Pelagomonas_calceolata.AAC.1